MVNYNRIFEALERAERLAARASLNSSTVYDITQDTRMHVKAADVADPDKTGIVEIDPSKSKRDTPPPAQKSGGYSLLDDDDVGVNEHKFVPPPPEAMTIQDVEKLKKVKKDLIDHCLSEFYAYAQLTAEKSLFPSMPEDFYSINSYANIFYTNVKPIFDKVLKLDLQANAGPPKWREMPERKFKNIYDGLESTISRLVACFDENKPLLIKAVKYIDTRSKNKIYTNLINKADENLDGLAKLIHKYEKELKEVPVPEGLKIHIRGDVNMTSQHLSFVRTLIEAANRLDLRAPTKITKDNLAELMAYLRALRDCYQSMHWTSRGSHYYGDHLLFERLYNEIIEEIDALAEKAIGYTDDAYVVEVQYQTSRVATHVAEIMSHLPDMTYIQCLLFAENRLCKELIPQMLNTLEQANELSDGVENFLQGIADKHEGNIYHLQRRLKTQEEMGSTAPVEPNISPPPATAVDVNQQFSNMMNTQGIR